MGQFRCSRPQFVEKPKISVILPTFNRGYIIKRAIRSVLRQTFEDFELIIVDDASTDNTYEVLKRFKDERIVYIKRSVNSQTTKENARNDGLKVARGKYIAYIDSDNSWLKNHLRVLCEFLEKNKKYGVVYCDSMVRRYKWKSVERSFDFIKGNVPPSLFIDTGEFMHKKNCIKKAGVWEYDGYKDDDWQFFLKITNFYKSKHLKKVLSNYYCSDNLRNASKFLEKVVTSFQQDNKITKSCKKLLKNSIECCNMCKHKEKIHANKIEDAAKTFLLFGDKKHIKNLL